MTNKYTTKKYLVGSQIEKYKHILRELQEEKILSISLDPISLDPMALDPISLDHLREPTITILQDDKHDLEEFMKGIL